MDLFRPSSKIIKLISSAEKELNISYFNAHLLRGYVEVDENLQGFKKDISLKYNLDKGEINWFPVSVPYYEAVKNSFAHGKLDFDKILIGHYIGDLGVCFGFYDGGDYFKNENIKNQYENKIPVKNFNKNPRISCRGNGTKRIFKFSDFIEVDSKKGILYIGKYKRSILSPENFYSSSGY